MSTAILGAKRSWTIKSLMTAYNGVDWRRKVNWDPSKCNEGANPSEVGYLGHELLPFEVMFVKVKERQRHLNSVR